RQPGAGRGRTRRSADPPAPGRPARPGRGPRPAGAGRAGQGPTGYPSLLRRDDHRAGGGSTEHLPGHGPPLLDVRPRLAAPADDRGAARVGLSKKNLSRGGARGRRPSHCLVAGLPPLAEGNGMTLEDIFLAAVEKAPADRAAYLDAACGSDAGLRAQVEALLRSHEEAGSLLEQPLFRPGPTVAEPSPTAQPGVVLAGRYKLLEEIGEGGMGTVWMAQQTEPVKRLVALKLIKAGMDSRQVIARFEAERQALALMDHANIARVLDAGATKGEPGGVSPGRPYFVMDLVKGVPITKYCDEHHLTPRQRLELFIPVCQAVQ